MSRKNQKKKPKREDELMLGGDKFWARANKMISLSSLVPEKVCLYKTFEQYGISAEDGRNRIKGPGVYARAGISQMGGRTPFRCNIFSENWPLLKQLA